jgi:hypothetical protein
VLPQFSIIRFAIAMAPRAMTRITATGVSHARIFVCNAVAPVKKGEACARANTGNSIARQIPLVAMTPLKRNDVFVIASIRPFP